jgi:hypothetical protein
VAPAIAHHARCGVESRELVSKQNMAWLSKAFDIDGCLMLIIRRDECPHMLLFTIIINITTTAASPQQAQSSAPDTWYLH